MRHLEKPCLGKSPFKITKHRFRRFDTHQGNSTLRDAVDARGLAMKEICYGRSCNETAHQNRENRRSFDGAVTLAAV
jgi:hypothetical protein